MTRQILLIIAVAIGLASCKKEGCTDENALNYNDKAKKDDGSCEYAQSNAYPIPSTFVFNDVNGNSTVNYSGQTERLNQLNEMTTYAKTGISGVLNAAQLNDMFSNSNNPFTFTSTKQLKNKCFSLDVALFESFFDSLVVSSQDFSQTASNGQAGTLTSGSSTYLFNANGIEYVQFVEKGLMGAVFMNQALNTYFGSGKMDVDNTVAVDPGAGKYYTAMQHHWDEAFGYFGVEIDFPSTIPDLFWGKYCNSQNTVLGSNALMMDNFLKGRAAIGANVLADRNAAISQVRKTWEDITANQAVTYLNDAIGYFGNDQAKYLHVLSEAYIFAWNIRYSPVETRRMTPAEHASLMALFGDNFWNYTLTDINAIKTAIQAKY